jgi:DNA-binding MarR family transcriptional regulator
MLTALEEQIIVALRQITQAIDLYSRSLLQEVGLSAPQIAVLREVAATEDVTPTRLAEELHLSPQTIAGILNRLEERRLVVREKQSSDRRSVRIRITSAGHAAAAMAPPLLRDQFRARLGQLQDWERTQILATLQRVASLMNASSLAVEPFLESGHVPPPAAEQSAGSASGR